LFTRLDCNNQQSSANSKKHADGNKENAVLMQDTRCTNAHYSNNWTICAKSLRVAN